jgi:integrase
MGDITQEFTQEMPTKLRTAAGRARLQRGVRHADPIAPGIAICYRRGPKPTTDGVWYSRLPSEPGSASPYQFAKLGLADDVTQSDGIQWFSYREAVEIALANAKQAARKAQAPLTVAEACAAYIERRKARGTGRPRDDETALRTYLGKLAERRVASLDHDFLLAWARRVPAYVTSALRAALNQVPRAIRPTSVTLEALREHLPVKAAGLIESVMSDAEVASVIGAARRHDHQFGLFVAVLAASGSRPGQIARCRKGDLLVNAGILVVPPSAKGQPGKAKPASRMPLDAALIRELGAWAARKTNTELLFDLPVKVKDGKSVGGWRIVEGKRRGWHKMDWGRAAGEAGIARRIYDLRHAAIVRMLLANVPIRVVAAKCDTSSAIIERHYSRWIGDASDDLVRAALAYRRLTVVA